MLNNNVLCPLKHYFPKDLMNFGRRPQTEYHEGHTFVIKHKTICRRFDPGGSLNRRVNCRRVPQPRWVGARRSTKGEEKETDVKGKPAAFVFVLRLGRVRLQ
jgi:hypothetical protein